MKVAWLAGIALGLASSAHCAAMCGPLVLSVGRAFAASSRWARVRHALLYHAARVVTYIALGLPAAFAGQLLAFQGLGRVFAIAAGVALLIAAFGSFGLRPADRLAARLSALLSRAATPALAWSRARPVAGALVTGAFNGLLPCGLVYAAVTAAAATANPAAATLLMAGFGMGTTVVLLALSLSNASLSPRIRARLRPLAPVALALTAAILIFRGVTAPAAHDMSAHRAAAHIHAH